MYQHHGHGNDGTYLSGWNKWTINIFFRYNHCTKYSIQVKGLLQKIRRYCAQKLMQFPISVLFSSDFSTLLVGQLTCEKNLRQSNNQKRKRHSNSEEIPKIPPKGIFSLSIFQKKPVKNHAQKTFSFSETQRIQIIRFGPSKDCSRSACPESPW